jgi:rhodanese-related sulfurtransferase
MGMMPLDYLLEWEKVQSKRLDNKMEKNFYIFFVLAMFCGCLKDDINIPTDIDFNSGGALLKYLEEHGNDYINTREAPSLIKAAEVYSNLNRYLIIDLRTNEEFINGHIQGARNVSNTELLGFLLTNNADSYQKVVLVSADGQESAFYTCLLRLYGFNNVFTLRFGMAYWNRKFSQIWLKKIKDSPLKMNYSFDNIPKGQLQELPQVFEKTKGNIEGLAKERIASFIDRGFVDKMDNINEVEIGNTMYFVCYSIRNLYDQGHPPNTVFYLESEDLKSIKDLQTLPAGREILIYDYNGQLSAAVTAYLQVLGYNAKSFLYGANQLMYGTMTDDLDIRTRGFIFLPEEINNFPYVTGN